MISLQKYLDAPWEIAKGYLRDDLDHLEAAINTHWGSTFDPANQLLGQAIGGDKTPVSRIVANTGVNNAPFWDQLDLGTAVKNRLTFSHLTAASAPSVLLGRRSTSAGDFEEISTGGGLIFSGTTLSTSPIAAIAGSFATAQDDDVDEEWPHGVSDGQLTQNIPRLGSPNTFYKLNIFQQTTEQLRLGYDASNYTTFTVNSVGSITLQPTGTNAGMTLAVQGSGTLSLGGPTIVSGTLTLSGLTDFTGMSLEATSTNRPTLFFKNSAGATELGRIFFANDGGLEARKVTGSSLSHFIFSSTGVLTLGGYTGGASFTAGAKYLVVTSGGVVEISALGPTI